jgi:hypothetical protein
LSRDINPLAAAGTDLQESIMSVCRAAIAKLPGYTIHSPLFPQIASPFHGFVPSPGRRTAPRL